MVCAQIQFPNLLCVAALEHSGSAVSPACCFSQVTIERTSTQGVVEDVEEGGSIGGVWGVNVTLQTDKLKRAKRGIQR